MIWFRKYTLGELNALSDETLVSHLGIELIEIGDDFLRGRMPVDERTVQPARLLHGGASVALAETLGSFAALMCVDLEKKGIVGQEVNANHLKAVRQGTVTGTARAIHLGGRSQVWDIRIENDAGKMVCISRLTVAVFERR